MGVSLDCAKHLFFSAALGTTGALPDLERAWLVQQTGVSEGTIQDLWHIYLNTVDGDNAIADQTMAWLSGLGYTGSINDRELAAYLAGNLGGQGGDLLMPQVMVVGTPLLTPYGVAV